MLLIHLTATDTGTIAGDRAAAGRQDSVDKYGSLTALVMSGMDVITFERPRAAKRTVVMADDCSRCREELARLTEENAALRRAALAFGSLAERLNLALQEERRLRQCAASGRETAEAVNCTPSSTARMRHSGVQS